MWMLRGPLGLGLGMGYLGTALDIRSGLFPTFIVGEGDLSISAMGCHGTLQRFGWNPKPLHTSPLVPMCNVHPL